MDNELNYDEFQEYLGKYRKFLKDSNMDEVNFLDSAEAPSERQIVSLFINDEDVKDSIDANDYDIKNLGKPDNVRIVEGIVWTVAKSVWYLDEGNVVSFLLINTELSEEEVDEINTLDIEHTDVTDVTYRELLEIAVANEDWSEAARLRDWSFKFTDLVHDLAPKLKQAIIDKNYEEFFRLNKEIQNYKRF